MALSPETAKTIGWSDYLRSGLAFVRHNVNQVFAGKFIYFLIAAVVLFLTTAVIYVLDETTPPGAEAIYWFLLNPGTLLLFYPSCYAIQADADSHMLETVFGIPDYRYKVWLVRNVIQYLVIAGVLYGLALFCQAGLADINITAMVFHLMFPIFFLSSVGFMFATLTRSGNGTAAIMIIILLFFWILTENITGSRWNLFHNPFTEVDPYEVVLWQDITLYNRIYLALGGMLANMMALLRLQKRERFI